MQGYDTRGNLVSRCYEYDNASLTRCYGATYDAVGNPTSLTDPEGTDVVAVDNLDRLSSVTRQVSGQPDAVESYAHNAIGALSVNAGVAMDHQRPALSNGQLTDAAVPASWNGQPVVLDAGGRITSFGGATLAYNRRNQLGSVTDGTKAEYYDYDVWGRRIGVIHEDSSGDFYVYEGANVEAILHKNGGTTAWSADFKVLYDGVDHPLRLNKSGTVAYYELDIIGNVRRLRGAGGTDLGGYRYTAFGKLIEESATIEQPLRWQGRLYTELAGGMYDVRAREWSPELAVFVSADEFQYLTTRGTLWGWPLGNPVRWRDPSGRIGVGLSLGVALEAGAGGGGAAQGSFGAGLVWGAGGSEALAMATGGLFAGDPNSGTGCPSFNDNKGFVVGATVGGFVGIWTTNAEHRAQLAGGFNTMNLSLPWFGVQVAFDNRFASGVPGGIFMITVQLGTPYSAALSAYPTYTEVWPK